MTIRFAAAVPAVSTCLSRHRAGAVRLPANDNGGVGPADAMLHAALRHFGEHGLAAATRARRQAETAFFAGDMTAYRWWLEICRNLDRRMAGELAARTETLN